MRWEAWVLVVGLFATELVLFWYFGRPPLKWRFWLVTVAFTLFFNLVVRLGAR